MTSPPNIANRITAGLQALPPAPALALLSLASEATCEAIAGATPEQIEAWAASAHDAAQDMQDGAARFWASVGNELAALAREKTTGVIR